MELHVQSAVYRWRVWGKTHTCMHHQ